MSSANSGEYFFETNKMLADKINICLDHEISPIFCCGEPLNIREAGKQDSHVETQLIESLFHLSPEQVQNIVIAYEPIWAIGTGKTATNEQANEVCALIRTTVKELYCEETADAVRIQYGGSVTAANAKELFNMSDIDGGLVGGASLKLDDFEKITKYNS